MRVQTNKITTQHANLPTNFLQTPESIAYTTATRAGYKYYHWYSKSSSHLLGLEFSSRQATGWIKVSPSISGHGQFKGAAGQAAGHVQRRGTTANQARGCAVSRCAVTVLSAMDNGQMMMI